MILQSLKPNDKVALVCTGSVCQDKSELVHMQQFLHDNYQLHAVFSSETYCTVSAKQRASVFMDYLLDDSIAAIVAARGGEGTADIIAYLDRQRAVLSQLRPKLLLGFSDFTPLLLYFSQVLNWPTVHGGGMLRYAKQDVDSQTINTTMQFICGQLAEYAIELQPLNTPAAKLTSLNASILGGNLSLLCISVKDSWELQASNRIIVIEDVSEKAHKIARMLKYLQRVMALDDTTAIILGDFIYQASDEGAIMRTLHWFAEHSKAPVFLTDQIGHGQHNLPVPFNVPVTLANHQLLIKGLGGECYD